jgi:hypothetical protein
MLDIDRNSLPQCVCTRFTQWVEAINPKKVTLIFPSSFMNRPSSMFGHTLLRLDSENSEPILSYVANFSAHTTNDNSLLYAAKGLAGGYPGVFAVQPYYESIKKYTDIENRDLWEFPLNLSPKEIQFLMMHLWELNSAYFDYYYFDENCSYHLLSLIEVIRPELELTEEYYLWAIPIDTARTVLNNIESTTPIFRPSQVSKIKAQAEHLSDDELALAQQIAEKKATTAELSEINPEKKARVLETAYDFLQFLRLKNEDESIDMDLSYHLLKERSAIEIKTPATVPTPTIRPDQGHGTSRVAASFGTFNDSLLAQYQFRAAYHDILDNHGGYLQGAEIRIFEFVVEQKETEQIKLESLTPVKILSLSPHDDLFGSTSWGLDANIERVYLNSDVDTLAGKFTGNAGTSWSFFSESTIAYGLFGLTAKYSGVIEDNIAIGPDFTAGVASSLTENLKLAPEFKVGSYLTSDKNTNFSLSLTSRYSINRNFALGVTISRNHEFDYFYTKALGQVFYYY